MKKEYLKPGAELLKFSLEDDVAGEIDLGGGNISTGEDEWGDDEW